MRRERVEYEADGLTLRSELFVGAGTGPDRLCWCSRRRSGSVTTT